MFVVDASIALAWCLDDETSPTADEVLHRLLIEGGIAPAHWPLEVANAFRSAQRRGRLDDGAVARARSIVLDLPVDVRPVETSTALGLIETAHRHDLSCTTRRTSSSPRSAASALRPSTLGCPRRVAVPGSP